MEGIEMKTVKAHKKENDYRDRQRVDVPKSPKAGIKPIIITVYDLNKQEQITVKTKDFSMNVESDPIIDKHGNLLRHKTPDIKIEASNNISVTVKYKKWGK
jgi:hypothetical protein